MENQKKNARLMFLIGGIVGIFTTLFSILDLFFMWDKYSNVNKYVTLICLIPAFLSIIFLFILSSFSDEKLYKSKDFIILTLVFTFFGNIASLILTAVGWNRIKRNYIIDNGGNLNDNNLYNSPNKTYQDYVNRMNNRENNNVEKEVVENVESPNQSKSMNEQLDELYTLYENGKISQDEFYKRKQEILAKYYGN